MRDVLPPSLGYPAVAQGGRAGVQQRLAGGHGVGPCSQQGLVACALGEDLCAMRVNGCCEPGLLGGQRQKSRVACSTRLSRATDWRGYYSSGRCFTCVGPSQMARPNSYRLMNSPITRSCMRSVLEKHSVRRTNRLIRVRRLMCLLSIFCVFSLPT